MKLRKVFEIPSHININWFPGHMHSNINLMKKKIKSVDVILEVRDSRAPFSSKNDELEEFFKQKKRIIIFNKSDIGNHNMEKKIIERFKKNFVIFTSTVNNRNINKIIPFAIEKLNLSKKFNSLPYQMMIYGLPNLGKSSIINAMKRSHRVVNNKKTAKKGFEPGVTRNLQGFEVSKDPTCILLDTPGIMIPKVDSLERGLKLSLIHSISDRVVPIFLLVDYLLFQLNLRKCFQYVDVFKMKEPIDDINQLLIRICTLSRKETGKEENILNAAHHFLALFRKGNLGNLILDSVDEEQME